MDTRQIQDLLHYLGYPLTPDGVWGPETEGALKEFQGDWEDLPATGKKDPDTEKALKASVYHDMFRPEVHTFWEGIPNFTREEFACKCGCGFPAEPKEAMVRIAQAARSHFGRPATVVSGLRCQRHNAAVGGVSNSQHMAGEACDLAVSGVTADGLLAFLQSQPGVRYAYKINQTNVHFDIPKGGI